MPCQCVHEFVLCFLFLTEPILREYTGSVLPCNDLLAKKDQAVAQPAPYLFTPPVHSGLTGHHILNVQSFHKEQVPSNCYIKSV